MAAVTPIQIPAERLNGLGRYNLIAGVFHLVQAVAIFALANSFALPVSVSYLTDAPIPGAKFEDILLFDFPVALGVALFSLLSSLAHFWIVGPGFKSYANDLSNMRNIARWVEYSISSTLMIVLISLINGIWNVVALL
ncbi:MAG: heliorhodopsin HeR, partial [Actinomycetales bacterium]